MPASSNGSGPTPPSGPSSAPEGKGLPASGPDASAPGARLVPRRGWVLVVVAAGALAASWNPLGAPFALLAGILVSVIAVRRLFAGGRRRSAAAALALGAGAAVASVMVLLALAGLGLRPEEKLDVDARSPSEARKTLDEAASRSSEARARAARQLEELPKEEQKSPGGPGRLPGSAH